MRTPIVWCAISYFILNQIENRKEKKAKPATTSQSTCQVKVDKRKKVHEVRGVVIAAAAAAAAVAVVIVLLLRPREPYCGIFSV